MCTCVYTVCTCVYMCVHVCTCAGHVTDVKEEFLSHPCMSADLLDPSNGVSALKHLRQQSSLLVHLERHGLLGVGGRATCYLEFGAGRGKLTECIHRAIKSLPVCIYCPFPPVFCQKDHGL